MLGPHGSIVFSDVENYFEILSDIMAKIESLGYECSIGCGTLLGYIREEQGFIPWDDDIDIYLYLKSRNQILAADEYIEFENLLYSKFETFVKKDKDTFHISFKYRDIPVDIFPLWETKGGKIQLYPLYEKFVNKSTFLPFREDFKFGNRIVVPNSPESILEKVYGEWKTEDKTHTWWDWRKSKIVRAEFLKRLLSHKIKGSTK